MADKHEGSELPFKAALHNAIQDCCEEDGLVVSWTCIVEISDGTDKSLTQFSGTGHDGIHIPPVWHQLGMAHAVVTILEDQLLAAYDEVEHEDDVDS